MAKQIRLSELERKQVDQVLDYSRGVAEERREWGRAVVLLAQGLRGIASLARLSWREVLPLLEGWIEDLGDVSSGDPDQVIEKFADVWPKIRNPFRFVDTALDRAIAAAEHPPMEVRAVAERLYPHFPLMVNLMAVCESLAKESESGVFFISARTAAKALGLRTNEDYPRAARLLRHLVIDGVLVEISKGRGTEASRYQWKA